MLWTPRQAIWIIRIHVVCPVLKVPQQHVQQSAEYSGVVMVADSLVRTGLRMDCQHVRDVT